MKFKGKPSGTFQDDASWNADRMAVEFTLILCDDDGERLVRCRVSQEALEDVAASAEPVTQEYAVRLFDRLKTQIYDAVDRKLKAGQFEDDVIIVRSADLNG